MHWNISSSNLSYNYLFLALPQYSISLVTFDFQSFINLFRPEKGFRFSEKNAKFLKNLKKFLSFTAPTLHQNITGSTTLTTPNPEKNYRSLPTTKYKSFEKFFKFSKRAPKKGLACFEAGCPNFTNQPFMLLLASEL